MPTPGFRDSVIVLLVATLLAGCGEGPAAPKATPPDLVVLSTADSTFAGDSVRVTAWLRVNGATTQSVPAQWTSADTTIARVDDAGWVRTRREGTVVIHARALGASAEASLRVRAQPAPAAITFLAAAESLFTGGETALRPTVTSQYGTPLPDVRLEWTSSDPAVATVDSLGRVRGVAPGRAKVSATAGAARADVLVDVREAMTLVQAVAGARHSCGLDTEGQAWCWGDHYWGQLGDSTVSGNQLKDPLGHGRPRRVAGGHQFTVLAANRASTCGITTAGVALCWGINARYWNGQSPDPDNTGNDMESTYPLPVSGATGLAPDLLVVGVYLQCGRAREGGLRCWGIDLQHALATGQYRLLLPAQRVLPDIEWRALSAMGSHYCGTTATGSARCFGANGDGQLGDGDRTSRMAPLPPYGFR